MRIAIAPNAFRGSMTALQAVTAISTGLRRSRLNDRNPVDLIDMPLADGGDGTLDVLLSGLGGERLTTRVTGPLGDPVEAMIGILPDRRTAVIEMARASGVELIPRSQRNPLRATTYGTGELIRFAVDRGCDRIFVGVGGSATVDGGAGCLQGLGIRLLDSQGAPISPDNQGLADLARIDTSGVSDALRHISITVLCDVSNPLIGESGAARVFGPQKGADSDMVEVLESNLQHYSKIVQRDREIKIGSLPRGGAAGGLAAGLAAYMNAELVSGGNRIIELLKYPHKLENVDLIITGEGKLDSQTESGKAIYALTTLAAQHAIPVIALAGVVDCDDQALARMGIAAAWSIVPRPCTLDEALAHGAEWLESASVQAGNMLAVSTIG